MLVEGGPLPRRATSPTVEQLKDLSDAFHSKSSSSHPKKKKKKTMKTVVAATTPLGKAIVNVIPTLTEGWNEDEMEMFTFALSPGIAEIGEWEKVAVLVDSKTAAECEEYYNRHMKKKREVEKKHGGKWKEVAVEILDVPGDKAKVKKDDKAKEKKDDKEKKKKVIDLT